MDLQPAAAFPSPPPLPSSSLGCSVLPPATPCIPALASAPLCALLGTQLFPPFPSSSFSPPHSLSLPHPPLKCDGELVHQHRGEGVPQERRNRGRSPNVPLPLPCSSDCSGVGTWGRTSLGPLFLDLWGFGSVRTPSTHTHTHTHTHTRLKSW